MSKLKYILLFVICIVSVGYFFSNTLPKTIFIDNAVKNDDEFFTMCENTDTKTYHLITHGRPGHLLIKGQWKNAQQIAAFFAPKFKNSGFNIQHLNIYGCEFAKGQEGEQAVAYLEHELGVVVSASTNVTGIDGDYLLEVGNMDASTLFEGFQGNLQLVCSPDYGIVPGPTNQYASSAFGGYPSGNYGTPTNSDGAGVPNGTGIVIYSNTPSNTSGTQYQGRFAYTNIFSGGSTVVITAKYIDSRHDGITLEFSTNNTTWVGLTPVINGFTSNYTNVTYTLPSNLRGQYKYIRAQGVSASTYLNVDAIRTNVGVCNTCPARLDAPALSSATVTTTCPSQTYNLSTITASNTPANTVLTWHKGAPATNANKIANTSAVPAGVYYAAFYHSGNDCYSGANGSATTQVKTVGDADCDGVSDANDLDDDNDGILDTIESNGVCQTSGGINLSALSFGPTTNTTNVSVSGNNFIITGNSWNADYSATGVSKPYLEFTIDNSAGSMMIGIIGASQPQPSGTNSYDANSYKFHFQDGVNYNIRKFNSGQINTSTFAADDKFSIEVDGNNYIVMKRNNVIVYSDIITTGDTQFKIYIATASGRTLKNVVWGTKNTITTTCGNIDSDGDGSSNQFDLDSDSDGCPDAFEAGVSANRAFTHFGASNVGANGFENSIEKGSESGEYNGDYYYSYAANSNIKACA